MKSSAGEGEAEQTPHSGGSARPPPLRPAAMAAAEPKTKYDRQVRIWGDQGQVALEKASICLLNCGPTGTETLKNLVLGGTGSVTVVDDSKVEPSDLGNNFLLDSGCLRQSREVLYVYVQWIQDVEAIKSKSICSFLRELNDAVKAKFVEESPMTLIDTNPSFFSQFTVVIATQPVHARVDCES